MYGFDGSDGQWEKKSFDVKKQSQNEQTEKPTGEGLDGGGGLMAKTRGVYEISNKCTK
jgi:hypothetical protein